MSASGKRFARRLRAFCSGQEMVRTACLGSSDRQTIKHANSTGSRSITTTPVTRTPISFCAASPIMTLNIAGDYLAYGIRERASEIVTLELGRQTELEVTKQLEREVTADRFTGLDRMLIAEQQGREFSDLHPDQDMRDSFRQNRALLVERARKLERMGLATEIETGKWMVSPRAKSVLRELGERGDIIKTVHRALAREGLAEDRHPGGYVLHRESATERIVGRVLDKGLGGDEMGERVRLVIDGVDGRAHHMEMDVARAEEVGRGMIVVAGSAPPGPRAADRNIIDVAGEGAIYRPSQHLERARAAIERIGGDPEAFVRSHVRRLEALRRACGADRRRSLARSRRSSRMRSSLRSGAGPSEPPHQHPVSYRP